MWRILLLCLSYLTCLGTPAAQRTEEGPPWVSCFEGPEESWTGPKTVRTPQAISANGQLRAYAVIQATAEGHMGCLNIVRLFVSTRKSKEFRQVYAERGTESAGTANSLRPISWSRDGRWLVAEFGNWFYASDAGDLKVLLYDRTTGKITFPDLGQMVASALKKPCVVELMSVLNFDALSRIHLRLADHYDVGDDEPNTHCFQGGKEWVLDPAVGWIRSLAVQ